MNPDEILERELERLQGRIQTGSGRFSGRLRQSRPVLIALAVSIIFLQLRGLPAEFSSTTLDAAAILQPAIVPANVRLITIDNDEYWRLFGGVSPLNPATLGRLLSAIAAGQPRVIVVDLDTSHPMFQSLTVPQGTSIVWAVPNQDSSNEKFAPAKAVGGKQMPAHWTSALDLILYSSDITESFFSHAGQTMVFALRQSSSFALDSVPRTPTYDKTGAVGWLSESDLCDKVQGPNGFDCQIAVSVSSNPQGLVPGTTYAATVPFTSHNNQVELSVSFKYSPAYVTSGALSFVAVTPCRVVDTRDLSNGPFGGPIMSAASQRDFVVPSIKCGIPAIAQAYSLNVTVIPTARLDYLTVWPSGQKIPNVSTINSDGRTKATAAIVPAGANGAVSMYVTDSTDVILDINGYFVPATDPTALSYYALKPCRIADTRIASPQLFTGSFGPPALAAGQARDFPILLAPVWHTRIS